MDIPETCYLFTDYGDVQLNVENLEMLDAHAVPRLYIEQSNYLQMMLEDTSGPTREVRIDKKIEVTDETLVAALRLINKVYCAEQFVVQVKSEFKQAMDQAADNYNPYEYLHGSIKDIISEQNIPLPMVFPMINLLDFLGTPEDTTLQQLLASRVLDKIVGIGFSTPGLVEVYQKEFGLQTQK